MCVCLYFHLMTLAEVKIENSRAHMHTHTRSHTQAPHIMRNVSVFTLNSHIYQLFVLSSCKLFAVPISICFSLYVALHENKCAFFFFVLSSNLDEFVATCAIKMNSHSILSHFTFHNYCFRSIHCHEIINCHFWID